MIENIRKEFENMEIEYTKQGDYFMPNLVMTMQTIATGKYARMRYNYLKNHKKAELIILEMNEKLTRHLVEVQKTATTRIDIIIKQFAKQENITEELKATNQMEWVRKINNIKNRAEEIVIKEVVYEEL